MRSTLVLSVLALAVSVSSMSISADHLAHRRGTPDVYNPVLQERAARRRNMSGKHAEAEMAGAKRAEAPRRRKRGVNARRCAVKSSSPAPPVPVPDTTPQAQPATKTPTPVKDAPINIGGSSGSGGSFIGEATFYGTGLGACGITNHDTDFICAVSQELFDGFEGYTGGNPNKNPICGRKLTATYKGKSVTVTVTDRCVACKHDDLDFAPSAFDVIANEDLGRLKEVTWTWN